VNTLIHLSVATLRPIPNGPFSENDYLNTLYTPTTPMFPSTFIRLVGRGPDEETIFRLKANLNSQTIIRIVKDSSPVHSRCAIIYNQTRKRLTPALIPLTAQ
jgi:hypothetical protein